MPIPQPYTLGIGGALPDSPDPRDIRYGQVLEVMGAPTVPSWEEGFDVEAVIGKLKTKEQNGSLSCVGQAFSYYEEALNTRETMLKDDFSARFVYAQIHLPEGAAYLRDGAKILATVGCALEDECLSYPNDETAMRVKPTQEQFTGALPYKAKAYAAVSVTSMDEFRYAIFQNFGCVGGFTGSNAGWSGKGGIIRPPKDGETTWGHGVFLLAFGVKNGARYLKLKNSWSDQWGDASYGYLFEDYFLSGNVFSPWTVTDVPNEFLDEVKTMLKTIKTNDRPEIYAVVNGKRYWVTPFKMYEEGLTAKLFAPHVEATESELLAIPEGGVFVNFNQ